MTKTQSTLRSFLATLCMLVVSTSALADEPFAAVKAIIGRLAGGYNEESVELGADTTAADAAMAKFEFVLDENLGQSAKVGPGAGDTIRITAANAAGASFGLGQYLRNDAKVHISWCGNRVSDYTTWPVPASEKTYTPSAQLRMAYNYCTISYTMAFWNQRQWREELDRLALNGFNGALVMHGLGKVWKDTLTDMGYTADEIQKFIPDAATWAWWNMGNIEGIGGPVSDAQLDQDAEMAKWMYGAMKEIGIEPLLQAFVGLVPSTSQRAMAAKYPSNSNGSHYTLLGQGAYQGLTRPWVLHGANVASGATGDDYSLPAFDAFAASWYTHLAEVYDFATAGDPLYLGGDLFHEGGSTYGVDVTRYAKKIQSVQQQYYSGVKWILQHWGTNPSQAFVNDLAANLTIIERLDLDMNGSGASNSGWTNSSKEKFPWIWCEVMNFGGNTGMYGGVTRYRNLTKIGVGDSTFLGWGLLSEGLETNPMVYDIMMEQMHQPSNDAMDDNEFATFMDNYLVRRYGQKDTNVRAAVQTLAETVLKTKRAQQGVLESVLCANPAKTNRGTAVSQWGPSGAIEYDRTLLYSVAEAYLEAARSASYKNLETFKYDFAELFLQLISDRARELKPLTETSKSARTEFRKLIELAERLLASSDRWRLDWHEDRTAGAADQAAAVRGYRRMVTTWVEHNNRGSGSLPEYAHRAYAGLIKDYYGKRWNLFLDKVEGKISEPEFTAAVNTLDSTFPTATLTVTDAGDLVAIGEEIMETLIPPAYSWTGNGNDGDWATSANWSFKEQATAYENGYDVTLPVAGATITASAPVTTGAITLGRASQDLTGLSATKTYNTTFVPATAGTIGWTGVTLTDILNGRFTGVMGGGWMGSNKNLACVGYFPTLSADGQTVTVQFQGFSESYTRCVAVEFTIVDGVVQAKAAWVKNASGNVCGIKNFKSTEASANGSPSVATSDETAGYGMKAISLYPSATLTLAGPITVGGALTIQAQEALSFTGTEPTTLPEVVFSNGGSLSAPNVKTIDSLSVETNGGVLELGAMQEIEIGSVATASGAKLILKAPVEALTGASGLPRVKAPREALSSMVFIGSDGEAKSLVRDASGYLKCEIGTLYYSSFVSSEYASTGWKNISLDDLAKCEFTGTMSGSWITAANRGMASRGYQIVKGTDTVTVYMQAKDPGDNNTKSLKLTFTLDADGYIYVKGSDGGYKSGDHCGEVITKTNNHVPTSTTADGYGVASITIKPAVAHVAGILSNYSVLTEAITAAKGAQKVTLLGDATVTASINNNFKTWIEIPRGITLSATCGDFIYWNKAYTLDIYGTLDLGGNALSVGTTKSHVINLYAGGEIKSTSAKGLAIFDANTAINVKANDGFETATLNTPIQARENTTINVEEGVTAVLNGGIVLKSGGESGVDNPVVTKSGAGVLEFNGLIANGATFVLSEGTLIRKIGPEGVFTMTVNGGTPKVLSADEDYEIFETAEGNVHTYTSTKIPWVFLVTPPGATTDAAKGGVKFRTLEEALVKRAEWGNTAKIWVIRGVDTTLPDGYHLNDGSDGSEVIIEEPIEQQEPFAAVKAIVGRLAGGYNGANAEGHDKEKADAAMEKFIFSLDSGIAAGAGKVETEDGKIKISASDASGASFALGQYLRHTAKMHISWCGNRVTTEFPIPTETTTYTPAVPVRFAYNYCTLSYTMAFWSAKEWREEIDRLALSGYNVALVLQGLQEAWRVTLESVHKANGDRVYSNEQIMKYVSDEAAQAWWHMGNLEGLGGPLGGEKGKYDAPGAYDAFKERTAADAVLGEYIYAEMMKLGIQPSIQSFVGLVPDCSNGILDFGVASDGKTFKEHANFSIINEGGWQGYTRPDVVNPLNIAFDEMSKYWYGALVSIYKPEVNGYTSYMGGDLFHEGGNKGSLTDTDLANIAKKIQDTQAQYFGNNGANTVTWVIQSWQGSPYQGIRNGLDTSKAIIQLLDKDMSTTGSVGAGYYAYKSTGTEHIPWIWVEVLNFGGNTGMHGGARRFRNLAKIGTDASHSASFKGYGILSEGLETNPMMYDMFNDAFTRTVGQNTSIDDTKINQWVSDYCERRYGLVDDNLKKAYGVLLNTVFDCSRYQEGCVENMLCAGPEAAVSAVSKWGPKGGIEYDPAELYPAAYAFLDAAKAHPELLELETYRYDFVELFLQLLGERGRVINADIVTPGAKRNLFIKMLDLAERLTASSNRWRLDWHEARTKTVCPGNEGVRGYRRMVTCWADGYAAGQATGLREYAFRAYAGLLKDYYAQRWLAWFDKLDGKITQAQYTAFLSNLDETFMTAELEATPSGDLVKIGEEILETLNPPALTINATGDAVNWTEATWTDAKGQSTTWSDDFDVNLSGVCEVTASSTVNVGSFTLTPSIVADTAVYSGYLPQGADNAVKLFSNLREEDRANVAYFRGTMNGGWVAEGEAKSYQMNDGNEYLEMQMQRLDDGYLKSVRVRTYFNPNDNGIWGYAVDAGNIQGGVPGANVTGTGTKVATSDGAEGYGIKNFEAVMNSIITLNGDIKINGTLTVSGGKLTLTTSDQASAPGEIIIENGTLILGADVNNVTLSNVKIGVGGKLIVKGNGDFTKTIKVAGVAPAAGTIVYDNGEEIIPLAVLSDGSLKVALAAKTYEGEITTVWKSIGWKNLTLDDLAACEFFSGGVRASGITKNASTVTMTINGVEVRLGFDGKGVVQAQTSSGTMTGLNLNPAEAQIVSSKTNYATFAEAVAVAAGEEVKILADTEIKTSMTAAMTVTIPSGITLKAEGKLPWDQGNATFNIYGTLDFGSAYKEFGYNNARHHVVNLYAGGRIKSSDIVSFYTDFTFNVKAYAEGGHTATFDSTFRSCHNTTINVEDGVTLMITGDIVPRANRSNTGKDDPYVIKTGAGTLKLGGILKEGVDATPHVELREGTLARALEAEEIFSAKVTSGTTEMTSADEDYEVFEPADPIDNVHTWKSQGIIWLCYVTDPGETGQNGSGKKFKSYADARAYAIQLRKAHPGQTVKMWTVVANEEHLTLPGGITTSASPNGNEILGWDEPVRRYYVSDNGEWSVLIKMGTAKDASADTDIKDGDIVVFYKNFTSDTLEISPQVRCTEIEVVDNAALVIGQFTAGTSIPAGWTIDVAQGSSIAFTGTTDVSQAQFNGKGTVTFDTADGVKTLGKISGTATITIPKDVTVVQLDDKSYIENALAGSGTLQVKNVGFAYTLTDGSDVKFTVDPSVSGSWKAVRNGNIVTFEENITRLWTGDAIATQAGEYTDLLIGITLDELINGGVYELGANFNGRRSYPPVVYSGITETSAIATFNNGSETATLELVQDGVKIKGRQTSGATITRVAAAIHYSFKGSASWDARPEELIDEDIIVVERFAELTLNYSFANHFVGEGTVITTVAPSTDLKDSSQFHNWKGTLVLSDMSGLVNLPAEYGNPGSVLELRGTCTGYFDYQGSNKTRAGELKVTGTLDIGNGYGGYDLTVAKLSGNGTINLNKTDLSGTHNIKVLDATEWNGTINEVENGSVKILFATIKIGDNFYFTNQEAKDASEPGQTIEFLKTTDGQILYAKDPTQTLRVHSGFNGNYLLDAAVEGLYYKSADLVGDGRSDLKFFAANDTAFGKTWTNIFLGPTMEATTGDWMTSTEWSRKSGNLLIRFSNGNVPHKSGGGTYDPCLIDGNNLRRVPVGLDGYKHVEAGTLDGWNTAFGVTNGVAVTISGYAKMQGGNDELNYIYVDKTSKLTLNGAPTKFERYFNLHSAATEGITIGFNRSDAKYNYYLEGDGTVNFTAQNIAGTHVIKGAAISLGVNDHNQMTETIKSKKLVSYQSKGEIVASIAEGAITKIDGNEELTEVTGRNLTLEGVTPDAVGSYALRVADDGIYLDYVAWGSRRYLRWNNNKTYWEATTGTDGNGNRGKAYLTNGSDQAAGTPDYNTEVVITTDDVVQFDSGFGDKTLYISPSLRGMCIKVLSGTTLHIGRANGQTTIPSEFIVIVEDGAKVILTSWKKEEAVIGDGVTFVVDTNHVGEGNPGEIEIDSNRVSSLSIGSLTSSVPVQTDSIPVKITNPTSSATIVVADTKDAANVEVKLPAQWVSETFLNKAIDLKSEGENGIKVWESYVLGLTPTDEASTPMITAEQTNDPDTFKLDIPNVAVRTDAGVTVTPKLMVGDSADGFTESGAEYDNGFTIPVPTGDTKVKYYKIKYEIK